MRPLAPVLLAPVLLAPVLLASLLSLPATAHAASAFSHFKYTVPPGWREARYANGVLLSPKDAPKGQHLDLTLMPSRDFAGTVAEALALSWDDVCLLGHWSVLQPGRQTFDSAACPCCIIPY